MHFKLDIEGFTDTDLDASLYADGDLVERFTASSLKDAEKKGARIAADYKLLMRAATRVEYTKSFEL